MPPRIFRPHLRLAVLGLAFFLLVTSACTPQTPMPTPTLTPVPTISIETLADFPCQRLGNTRTITLLLPPGYAASQQAYPVLYANDGQDFALLDLPDTLNQLYAEGKLRHLIVIAVHTTSERLNEYGTAGLPNADGLGARAAEYTQCLLDEIMPAINDRYRTLTGPENTAIMGASLGGLSAFDIAWNHPEVFGTVGVFSGSFWWRSDNTSSSSQQNSRIMQSTVRQGQYQPGMRFWFETGTNDETADRDGNGVIDAIQDTQELIDELKAHGYQMEQDIAYLEIEGGTHSQPTWAQALPVFLQFAFPPNP